MPTGHVRLQARLGVRLDESYVQIVAQFINAIKLSGNNMFSYVVVGFEQITTQQFAYRSYLNRLRADGPLPCFRPVIRWSFGFPRHFFCQLGQKKPLLVWFAEQPSDFHGSAHARSCLNLVDEGPGSEMYAHHVSSPDTGSYILS
jgi:hypothetical protein